jgi:hypothetical protein
MKHKKCRTQFIPLRPAASIRSVRPSLCRRASPRFTQLSSSGGYRGRGGIKEKSRRKGKRQDFFISLESDTNLLVILFLVNGGLGNTVQITLTGLSNATATLVLILLENTNLLKGLEDLALDGTGGIDVVARARATVLGRAVHLAETANTDGLTEVDVTGNGGSTDVVPMESQSRLFEEI